MKLETRPLGTTTGKPGMVNIDENRDFVGSGGEKKVYVHGGLAYGVYHDPANAIDADKAAELAVAQNPSVLVPTGLLYKGSKRVGEYGAGVDRPYSLTELTSRTFLEDHALGLDKIAAIVQRMNTVVAGVHSHGIFIVDNNANNWLVSEDFQQVFAIDCGNWKTPNFDSEFIMLSIQDPHNPAGMHADWFAQAILIGLFYIGRHPFSATNPRYTGIPKKEKLIGKDGTKYEVQPRLQAMMKDGTHFGSPDCTLPKQCYPLDCIPSGLRAWMYAAYEHKNPGAPPSDFDVVAAIQRTVEEIHSSRKLEIKRLAEYEGHVIQVIRPHVRQVTLTTAGWYDNTTKHDYEAGLTPAQVQVGFTDKDNAVLGWLDRYGNVVLSHQGKIVNPNIRATTLGSGDGRIFGLNKGKAWNLNLRENGPKLMVSTQSLGSVLDMPNATRAYRGCVVMNMLGSWRVNTFPAAGQCMSTRLEPLEGQRIVNAAYTKGILMVVGEDNGIFNRYLYMEDERHRLHLIREEQGVDDQDLNFTVNDKGGWTHIPEDGVLEATKVGDPTNDVRIMRFDDDDITVTTEFRLDALGSRTAFHRHEKYYQLGVK